MWIYVKPYNNYYYNHSHNNNHNHHDHHHHHYRHQLNQHHRERDRESLFAIRYQHMPHILFVLHTFLYETLELIELPFSLLSHDLVLNLRPNVRIIQGYYILSIA